MKILLLLHSHDCGGAEKHAWLLMQGLQAEGHQVAFAGPLDSWLADQAKQIGIRCFHVPMHGFYDPYSLWCAVKVARTVQADLLHGHMARGSRYAGLAAALLGKPMLSTAHATDSHKHFKRAGKIIAVSTAVRDHLLAHGYSASQVEIIYNGIPLPDYSSIDRQSTRSTLGLADGQIALCMVARFVADKGQDLAVAALAQLRAENLRLFLIGKAEGAWFENVRQQIAAAGLERQVSCLGHREDIAELLAGMDILLAPSRREAFGLAILDAWAAGLPVIATRVGGIPEIITDGEDGLLCASEDLAAFCELLRRLTADAALRDRLSKNAKATFLNRFEVGNMLQATLQIYRELAPAA